LQRQTLQGAVFFWEISSDSTKFLIEVKFSTFSPIALPGTVHDASTVTRWSMSRLSQQSGFSLIELMIGAAILVAVFGGSFMVLQKTRAGVNARNTSGPHLYFESFASSRLKLYFSKLMQWTTHMGASPGQSANVANFCQDTRQFAYASGALDFGFAPRATAQQTLGADMRMSLSTLEFTQVSNRPLTGRVAENGFPWGAMVPFSNRTDAISGIDTVNFNLDALCRGDKLPTSGIGAEMCAWVDVCSGQEGNRSPNPVPNPNPTADGVPILAYTSVGGGDVTGLNNRTDFRMCFAFVGNLFSRVGDFTNAAAASSTGLNAVDNPAVLGLAVATAKFTNTSTGKDITCNVAVNEMNRSLKVKLDLYTTLNADKSFRSGLQQHFRTQKEITSEKLGVSIPNCDNPSRDVPIDAAGNKVCIADPTWIYRCADACANPNQIGN
jgi:prepilin-type N-terminal cleavage/methylation domain-containing protein